MRNHRSTLLAILLFAAPLAAQEAQGEDLAERHRRQVERDYAAAGWTRGPVREGLANELELEGLVRLTIDADEGRLVRHFRRTERQPAVLLVTSRVADTSAGAHADLITWLAGLQSTQRMPSVPDLGDAAFVGASGAARGAVSWVAFVRGNVFVRLNNLDPTREPGLDLVDLARGIDLDLLGVPILPEGARPARPEVAELTLAEGLVTAGARVRLTAEVADAHGGTPHLTWSLGGAGLGYVELAQDGVPYLFTTGPGTLEVHREVTSSMGTFTRASVSLEVLDD